MPSLIRTNGQLIAISTPYRKLGLLYQKYRDHFGVDDDDVLVVQGDSRSFNPTLSERDIAQAMANDPEAGASEWQGLFPVGIAAFLSDADIDACVDYDRPSELPPRSDITYHAFVDPSGGRHDAFTLAVAYIEDRYTIIDVLRAAYPNSDAGTFNTKEVVAEFAALLKQYRISAIVGDNYAAEWVGQAFQDAGIRYVRSELSTSRIGWRRNWPHGLFT